MKEVADESAVSDAKAVYSLLLIYAFGA